MLGQWPQRVLLLDREINFGGEFEAACVDGLRALGCTVERLSQAGHPGSFDLFLAYGPNSISGRWVPETIKDLAACAPQRRPVMAWWQTEGLSDARLPAWFVNGLANGRASIDRLADVPPAWKLVSRLGLSDLWSFRGRRLRMLNELRWLRAKGLLDVLAGAVALAARISAAARGGYPARGPAAIRSYSPVR